MPNPASFFNNLGYNLLQKKYTETAKNYILILGTC